jgi:predicted XRE-type DNA-binding protein
MRSTMMRAQVAFIREEQLTQAQGAKLFGVTNRVCRIRCAARSIYSRLTIWPFCLPRSGWSVDLKIEKAA